MSFDPLPKSLLRRLQEEPGLCVLDLGCGDGRFGRVLAGNGARPVGLDRCPPGLGSSAQVVGDVVYPPLAVGCWSMVAAANLVRHLAAGAALVPVVNRWLDLLTPGGDLYLLEDAPGGQEPAQRNYAALQDLLAELPDRGPLLDREEIVGRLECSDAQVVEAGSMFNIYDLDATAVVSMLRRGELPEESPAARLAAAIERDGVACGPYWWLHLRRKIRNQ